MSITERQSDTWALLLVHFAGTRLGLSFTLPAGLPAKGNTFEGRALFQVLCYGMGHARPQQIFTAEPMGTLKNTDMRRDYGLYETKMFLTGKPTGLEVDLLSLLTWVYSFNLNSIPSALFLRGCEGFSFKYLGGGKETNKTSYPEVIFQF